MKFSKIGALLLTLACLLLPFSSATAAGAGVWDNIGTYGMTSQTPIIKSSGGNFIFTTTAFTALHLRCMKLTGREARLKSQEKFLRRTEKQQSGDRCQQFYRWCE